MRAATTSDSSRNSQTAEGHTDSKHTPSFEVYADGEKLAEWKEAGASTNGVWSVVEGGSSHDPPSGD